MAPFPTMTFPYTWEVYDEKTEAYVFEALNAFPEPFQPDGTPYAFPTWTRLVYGGGGLWKSEEDVYNPARDAGQGVQGVDRGGREDALGRADQDGAPLATGVAQTAAGGCSGARRG